MSWGLSWKRPPEPFRLTLCYGSDVESLDDVIHPAVSTSVNDDRDGSGFRIDLDWSAGEDEEQFFSRLQSQFNASFPPPEQAVEIELRDRVDDGKGCIGNNSSNGECNLESSEGRDSVAVAMKVVTKRELLKGIILSRAGGSGQQNDGGMGVLLKLMKLNLSSWSAQENGLGEHWRNVTVVNLCGLGLTALSVEITQFPLLEELYIDNNKLIVLPPEIGSLKNLKVLVVDYNMLVSVPVELKECTGLVALSLEHNKLVRPLLDFRVMSELRILRLFGNPLEFLPDILPLNELRHLSLANIRIEATENLGSVNVQIEVGNSSYFAASRHKLSAFFSLIFRFSSCHHPLLASALAKIMQDEESRVVVGRDETALRQLISMISSDNQHVVEQACSALLDLASDVLVAMHLIKLDIMQPTERVLISGESEKVISVLNLMVKLAFVSEDVARIMFNKDILKALKLLCDDKSPEVQRLALYAIGNLAFCLENRSALLTSESLRELLLRLTVAWDSRVCKAADRVLAILGENELLRRAVKGKKVSRRGLRVLTMDGGGMKGLATVRMLKEIEKGTGRQIHELFDLICGTSTGGMLAAALGIKLMSLEKCEEIYKELGKLVFADPIPKDNEAATWKEKLDHLYKSSSKSFRVAVYGSKHSACEFERLLKEMCADEDGDLLIESAVKQIPKVFIVSTLVSVSPAQPFIFRNYQYPAGTKETPIVSENTTGDGNGAVGAGAQVRYKCSTFMGSCKHHLWQAIRASSAAPYYLDDFSDGIHRWQDGAIVANNPTIFAIREAQLLWPDAKIDCLVSVGCGSVPAKVRKGGWRYLDTGQVLIESACSVERVEEALSTLLAMLPDIQYFRFNPVDERCDMELDETDPAVWVLLENATNEFIQNNLMEFTSLAEKLLQGQDVERFSSILKPPQNPQTKVSNENNPSLGQRQGVLLVETSNYPGRDVHHTHALETFCAENGIRLSRVNVGSGSTEADRKATFPMASTPPKFTGSPASSPSRISPGSVIRQFGKTDSISFDRYSSSKKSASPTGSPQNYTLPAPVAYLHEKIVNSPQVGIVHLALENDTQGAVLSWQNDIYVIAEPGELAENFLQKVKCSLLSMLTRKRRKYPSVIHSISTVANLVSCRPTFQIGAIVHKYIGRQTYVVEDDQEIGAYMFRRTIPCVRLTPEDVHSMIGDWRDRIIFFSGLFGPTQALTKAFLDAGAKAVVSPSSAPEEIHLVSSNKPEDANSNSSRFEIGEDEGEEEESFEPGSPASDWEDGPEGKGEHKNTSIWDDHEKEMPEFITKLYDSLYGSGDRVDVALQKAAASRCSIRYTCHLPC